MVNLSGGPFLWIWGDIDWSGMHLSNFSGATYAVLIQTQKGSNECLFILTRKHSMQIFGEIPFIKPQNDT